MANTSDDLLRIILEVQGRQELERLNESLQDEAVKLSALEGLLRQGARVEAEHAAQLRATRDAAQALTEAQKRLGDASGAAGAAGARGILEFSRAAEDFSTGGFLGLLNNIPGMVQSAGQAFKLAAAQVAGLTAGISIAATTAFTLYKNWDKLAEAIGLGATRTEAEAMDALAEKTHRTAEETARLNKYKREQSEIEAVLNAQTKADRSREQQVKEAIGEAGGKTTVDALVSARNKEGLEGRISQEDRDEVAELRRRARRAAEGGESKLGKRLQDEADARHREALAAAREAERKRAAEDLGKAPGDVDHQRMLINELGGRKDQRQFVRQLTEALPENIQKRKDDEEFNKGQKSLDESLEHQGKEAAAAKEKAERESRARFKRELAFVNRKADEGADQLEFEERGKEKAEREARARLKRERAFIDRKADEGADQLDFEERDAEKGAPKRAHDAEVQQLAGQVRQFTGGGLSPQQSVEVAKKALADAAGNQELLQVTTLAAIEDLIQSIQAQQAKAARMMGAVGQVRERARVVRHRANIN